MEKIELKHKENLQGQNNTIEDKEREILNLNLEIDDLN